MPTLQSFWSIRNEERFRKKVVELATEFCLEASVLIGVLGILESAIAWHGMPPYKTFFLSGGVGALFFLMGCIIQAQAVLSEMKSQQPERSTDDLRDS